MAKKKSRKSRKSLGIQGSPQKARTSVGMKRLLNQVDAFKKGKRVVLKQPSSDNPSIYEKIPAEAVWKGKNFESISKKQ